MDWFAVAPRSAVWAAATLLVKQTVATVKILLSKVTKGQLASFVPIALAVLNSINPLFFQRVGEYRVIVFRRSKPL
jgi:hypothetical protein